MNRHVREASSLVHSKFNPSNWHKAYDMNFDYHEWNQKQKESIRSKDLNQLTKIENLAWYERIAEERFPFAGGSILEIGAEYGRFSIYKAATSNSTITATDASKKATLFAEEKLKELDLSSKIKRVTMLAESLDFPDSSFDRVYAFESLEHVGDLNKALAEINRVLNSDLIFSIPFHNTADSGFHTQKMGVDSWITNFRKYFLIDELIIVKDGTMAVGRALKK
jgi:ubiquinone/menaquinone biosynthesis C-methylase UbiE